MDSTFAHLSRWRFTHPTANSTFGCAVLSPYREAYVLALRTLKDRGSATWNSRLRITTFSPGFEELVRTLLLDIYGTKTCAVCLAGNPCWAWSSDHALGDGFGRLDSPRLPTPPDDMAKLSVYEVALRNLDTDIYRQLSRASPELLMATAARNERRGVRPARPAPYRDFYSIAEEVDDIPEPLARVVTPQVVVPATPMGTVRCTHCHQVIPPGFSKETDKQKTQAELYASCNHIFDQSTNVCSKCRLPRESEETRFSLLEVD